VPGDTFVFAGEILQYEALVEDEVYVSRAASEDPKVPAYEGGKFPLSTYLPSACAALSRIRRSGERFPRKCASGWKSSNGARRCLASANCWLRHFRVPTNTNLVCYPFEGRLAHQTLGMLLTRPARACAAQPLGFVANEYALAVWGLGDVAAWLARGELSLAALFDEDMLGDDLEAWARRDRR